MEEIKYQQKIFSIQALESASDDVRVFLQTLDNIGYFGNARKGHKNT